MKKVIFAWHVHHDVLVEPLTEPIKNRIKYIKEFKPENEIKLRLRLLKVVKGELPKELVEAGKQYCEVRRKFFEAYEEGQKFVEIKQKYYKAKWEIKKGKLSKEFIKTERQYYEARQKITKTEKKYDEARRKFIKAKEKYYEAYKKYESQILSLHAKECPNCPWDGETIFSKR